MHKEAVINISSRDRSYIYRISPYYPFRVNIIKNI